MFSKYKKEFEKAGYVVHGDTVSNSRGDVMMWMDPYGGIEYKDDAVALVLCEAMRKEQEEAAKPKKAPAKKKRARTEKGHYKADDPSTPDVNEAWEE